MTTSRLSRQSARPSPKPSTGQPATDPAGSAGVKLHALQNTLASLRLRLSVLAADPTCRWAQEENITALQRIADQAMGQAHELSDALHGSSRRTRKAR